MADDETPETPRGDPRSTPSRARTPAEIAGSAEDAPLEAFEEAQEHAGEGKPAPEAEPFDPIAGNAVPTDDATEIAGSAEDAPLEAAQEAEERAEAEELVEAYEEDVAEEIAEKIVEEIVEEAVAEEIVAEAIEEAVAEEIVAEADRGRVGGRGRGGDRRLRPSRRRSKRTSWRRTKSPRRARSRPCRARTSRWTSSPRAWTRWAATPITRSVRERRRGLRAGRRGRRRRGRVFQEDEEVLAEPISTAAIDLASGARYRATGKRKTAIARVTLRPGTGTYLVNGRVLEEHFPRVTLQRNIRQPLETVGYQDRMDVVARLHGGGISAQAGALRHGVSRALLEADPNLRGELKRRGFLTRDSRAKERKKAGLKKARKRPQFSKR